MEFVCRARLVHLSAPRAVNKMPHEASSCCPEATERYHNKLQADTLSQRPTPLINTDIAATD